MKFNLSTNPKISAVASAAAFFSLITGSALTIAAAPAQAFSFGNGGIEFDTDTSVTFNFLGSNGQFQSTLEVADASGNVLQPLFAETAPGYNATTPDFPGSVTDPTPKTYLFNAGQQYTLRLDSLLNGVTPSVSPVFSTNSLNTPQAQEAIFTGDLFAAPGVSIAFEDKGGSIDFNDFRVSATAKSVPEPASLAGLGLVAGVLLVSSRRKVGNRA